MEGKIVIEMTSDMGVSVDMNVRKPTWLGILCVFDALVRGFKLGEEAQAKLGILIGLGGLSTLPGVETKAVEFSPELVKIIRDKENEGKS